MEKRDVMTVKEVADFLSVDPETIRKWRKDGKLNGHKIGNRSYRFLRSEVEEFLMKTRKEQ